MTGKTLKVTTELSPRQKEVAVLIASGTSIKEIPSLLTMSLATVKVHIANIYEKLGIHSKTELIMHAIREGWIPCPCKNCVVKDES